MMVGGGAKFLLFFNKMKRDEDLELKNIWKSGFPENIFVERVFSSTTSYRCLASFGKAACRLVLLYASLHAWSGSPGGIFWISDFQGEKMRLRIHLFIKTCVLESNPKSKLI